MATFEVLTNQMGEMKLSVEGLEKERDFYFNKVSTSDCLESRRALQQKTDLDYPSST